VPMAPMAQSLPRPPKPPTTMRKLVNWVSGARGHDQRKKTKASDPSLKALCVMCLDLEKNTAFDKCGHFGFCSKCTEGLSMCPRVRKTGGADSNSKRHEAPCADGTLGLRSFCVCPNHRR
jgi:hypothetical protein